MGESLTRALGAFVSSLRLPAVPPEALAVVHTGFADCVGTMIAGSVEEPPKLLYRTLAPPPGEACQRRSNFPSAGRSNIPSVLNARRPPRAGAFLRLRVTFGWRRRVGCRASAGARDAWIG